MLTLPGTVPYRHTVLFKVNHLIAVIVRAEMRRTDYVEHKALRQQIMTPMACQRRSSQSRLKPGELMAVFTRRQGLKQWLDAIQAVLYILNLE